MVLALALATLSAAAGGVSGGGGGDGYTRFYKTSQGELTTSTTLSVVSPVPFVTLNLSQTEAYLSIHPEFRDHEITLSGSQAQELLTIAEISGN